MEFPQEVFPDETYCPAPNPWIPLEMETYFDAGRDFEALFQRTGPDHARQDGLGRGMDMAQARSVDGLGDVQVA